ncbi:hypothetical protein GCM10011324_40030 [Allosediminivita pacifica]|nr:hypothetical protein GCM10011324_40030 [Allosediminivita pacifica]
MVRDKIRCQLGDEAAQAAGTEFGGHEISPWKSSLGEGVARTGPDLNGKPHNFDV